MIALLALATRSLGSPLATTAKAGGGPRSPGDRAQTLASVHRREHRLRPAELDRLDRRAQIGRPADPEVLLHGDAAVQHPQYKISGEQLIYDLNVQHFQGSSDANGNGRIHIRLDPEVIDNKSITEDIVDQSGKENN